MVGSYCTANSQQNLPFLASELTFMGLTDRSFTPFAARVAAIRAYGGWPACDMRSVNGEASRQTPSADGLRFAWNGALPVGSRLIVTV